ncbi:MAG TPA: hypothetical protein VMH88_13370 [Gemmatimonadales bacterium]|nr:hypothetical protein [Gemmatimonadales bacterium]
MPFHRCTLCYEDGKTMATDITVALEEMTPADATGWFGTISVTHPVDLVAGRRYQLVLDDGRRGTFVVRRNTIAGEEQRAIAIYGMGPLR